VWNRVSARHEPDTRSFNNLLQYGTIHGYIHIHMDYVKIPQNIRVEDKLIGPLSLRQIIMIAIGGGVSYTLFAMLSKTYGQVPPVAHVFIWLPLVLCAAFALVKINDISLMRYSLLTFELMVKPRRRVFQPRRGLNIVPKPTAPKPGKKSKEENMKKAPEKGAVLIDDLSALLDRGGEASGDHPQVTATDVFENTIGAQAILDADEEVISDQRRRLDVLWQEMKSGHPATTSS